MTTREARARRTWCLFRSGARPYAVGLEAVVEIVEAERPVRLALSPPRILGLCTVRRDVVPVLSLGAPSAAEGRDPESRSIILILRARQGTWGLRIDREGTLVAEEGLGDLEEASPEPGGPVLLGSIQRDGTTYAVIDPEQTWCGARASIEQFYKSQN